MDHDKLNASSNPDNPVSGELPVHDEPTSSDAPGESPSGLDRILSQTITQDEDQTGLELIPGSTGIGKTYAVLNFIADQLIEYGEGCRRFVFTTNVKRNLPDDKLYEILEQKGHPELKNLVIFLDSNADSFKSNLSDAEDLMQGRPYEYQAKGKSKKKAGSAGSIAQTMEKKAFDILKLPEFEKAKSTLGLIETTRKSLLDGPEKTALLKNADDRFEEAECLLRKAISSVFSSMVKYDEGDGHVRYLTLDEKLDIVELDPWWAWLPVLYPAVLSSRKRVFFMSVNKMLVKNSTIIQGSESIWESDILKGSVVFIDEFERSKEVMNRQIIADNIKRSTDAISLFHAIFGPAREGRKLSRDLFHSPTGDPKGAVRLLERYEKLQESAAEVFDELHLENLFCLDEGLRFKDQAFLFQDSQSQVLPEKNNWVAVSFEEDQNRILFGSGKPPYRSDSAETETPDADCYSASLLLSRIEGMINSAIKWIRDVAENYVKLVAKDAEKGRRAEIDFDQAVGTVLSELNIMDEVHGGQNPMRSKIIDLVSEARGNRGGGNGSTEDLSGAAGAADDSLHNCGFTVYSFAESRQYDTQTRMERYSLPCTAERKLLELCDRNLVVGISATVDIQTVLGNFDLPYIAGMLGDRYRPLDEEARALIDEDYQESICHYNRTDVKVSRICAGDADGRYSAGSWNQVFNDRQFAQKAFNMVQRRCSSEHYRKRILRICVVYAKFWRTPNSYACLCVLNKVPKSGDGKLDLDLLQELFAMVLKDIDGVEGALGPDEVSSSYCVLAGKGSEYEAEKEKALNRLFEGEKLFLVTTYGSAGAGQNLQYRIPEGRREELVNINDRPDSEEMDIDSAYFEAPTHTAPWIEQGRFVSQEEMLDYLLKVEYLYESEQCEITQGELEQSVKHALAAQSGAGRGLGFKSTPSAKNRGGQQLYQATGRLDRTNMKAQTIRICVDEEMPRSVDFEYLSSCGLTLPPEFKAIVDEFVHSSREEDAGSSEFEADAKLKQKQKASDKACRRSRGSIKRMLGSGWNEDSMNRWIELGDQVLCHPTLSDGWQGPTYLERDYYVDLMEPSTSYAYMKEGDFDRTEVVVDGSFPDGCLRVGAEAARLDLLMRNPELEQHFQEQGYATHWELSERIMAPIVFQNIYEGRLGEACGRFILESCGLAVEAIADPRKYEKFDFILRGNASTQKNGKPAVYIDFKHWKRPSDRVGQEAEDLKDWIFEKMEAIDADRAIVANILVPEGGAGECRVFPRDGRRLLIVPALMNEDGGIIIEAIEKIWSFVYGD